jgi:uncharacterized protein YaiI (UPF0178 family)
MLEIYVDADGCPVKDEVYRVADRYGLRVWVVANAWLRVPDSPLVQRIAVGDGLDRADDWIAEQIGTPTGRRLTEASIGDALATRNLMTGLREAGEVRGGGRPFSKQDRSRFLGALDAAIQAIRRTEKKT